MRKAVTTSKAPAEFGPYSQAIQSGGFLFISGQGPIEPQTGEIIGEGIEEQTKFTLDNIRNILEAAGCSLDDVVKINVILADLELYDQFNAVYQSYFERPYPARTCFSGGLSDILVEIDAIVELPANQGEKQ